MLLQDAECPTLMLYCFSIGNCLSRGLSRLAAAVDGPIYLASDRCLGEMKGDLRYTRTS
jgi:hypothetical protein